MEKINFQNNQEPALCAETLNLLQDNIEKGIEEILQKIKPVGSIEINITGVNPSEYLGGTWISWGSGKVPVGVDTSETEFDTIEKTGGTKMHTLTVEQLPRHTHKIVGTISPNDSATYTYPYVRKSWGSGFYDVYTENTGEGQAHNNLQPYITCYMWKRIE